MFSSLSVFIFFINADHDCQWITTHSLGIIVLWPSAFPFPCCSWPFFPPFSLHLSISAINSKLWFFIFSWICIFSKYSVFLHPIGLAQYKEPQLFSTNSYLVNSPTPLPFGEQKSCEKGIYYLDSWKFGGNMREFYSYLIFFFKFS